jgi:hypothetical protein
VCEEKARVQL